MPEPSGWEKVNWTEVAGSALVSFTVGIIRVLALLREKRKIHWVDAFLEPSLAIFAGLLMWAIGEVASAPDLLQAVFTSLGAWGGPHTIRKLEEKYMGKDMP
jgi:hypothetical protein